MKKTTRIFSLVAILILITSVYTGAKSNITRDEALLNYQENKESHNMSEKQFEKDVGKQNPNAVLLASSIEGVFEDITSEDIYGLYNELGSSREVIDYLTKQDKDKNRSSKKTFSTKTTEEQKSAQRTYDEAVKNGADKDYLISLDSENIRNGTEYNNAVEEFMANPELYCFSSIEDLEYYLSRRPAGEVLFAGTVAKSFNHSLQDVFYLIDTKNGNYEEVMKFFIEN